jgi:hypothetical protein
MRARICNFECSKPCKIDSALQGQKMSAQGETLCINDIQLLSPVGALDFVTKFDIEPLF